MFQWLILPNKKHEETQPKQIKEIPHSATKLLSNRLVKLPVMGEEILFRIL